MSKQTQKPGIGRLVHYVQQKPAHYGEGVVHLPAVVTAVWGDACVNLMVFTDGSNSEVDGTNFQHVKWVTSATLDESAAPAHRTWHWPETVSVTVKAEQNGAFWVRSSNAERS